MMDVPNKQNQAHKQGVLKVLTTFRAYKCQGFPHSSTHKPKVKASFKNNISAQQQQQKFFPYYLFLELLSIKHKIPFKKICRFTFIYSDSNGTK